jgi:hypothetical protein
MNFKGDEIPNSALLFSRTLITKKFQAVIVGNAPKYKESNRMQTKIVGRATKIPAYMKFIIVL